MDFGRYFSLDTDASDIGRGLAVFRYRPDGETDSAVYAIITDTSMEFHIAGKGTNSRVLNLPLEEDLDRSLDTMLAESFTLNVPIPDKASFNKNGSEGDQRGYFTTFFDFGKKKGGKKIADASHPWKCWADDSNGDLPLAKLVLDFLFDLQETRIFTMSPNHKKLSEKLNGDFFSRALAAKAQYLYQRAILAEVVQANKKRVHGRDRNQQRDAKHFYGELFFAAEKEWTVCIRDSRSDKAFHNSNGWFDDSETEMMRVYRPGAVVRLEKKFEREKEENDQIVSEWLTARYSALAAWRVFLGGHRSFFGMHLFFPRIVLAVVAVWLPLLFVENMNPSNMFSPGPYMAAFTFMLLALIFFASLSVIMRVVPLVKSILWRASKLTALVVTISFVVGGLLLGVFKIKIGEGTYSTSDFLLFTSWSAFGGLVLQFILQNTNPSESI